MLASRGRAALAAAAAECRTVGAGSVTVLPVDVRGGAAVQRFVKAVIAEHGRIDAVCHAAGVVVYGRFEDVPPEIFDAVLATNLSGAANVARAILPVLRRQKRGSLILVGSVLGDIAVPSMTAYVVSKHAVRSLGRQLALENRDLPGVHVTVISPGGVDTPIYRQAANYQGRAGRPPAPVDSAAKVARAIVTTVDRPRDRISVGSANSLMRAGFTVLPRVFDAIVGPIFRATAMKPGSCPATTGNVLEPRDDQGAVSGDEGQGLTDLLGPMRGADMATNSRLMRGVDAAAVFDVLRDGTTYGTWVVGTRKIRRIEPDWPQPGSSIHYTVGYAPFRKDDQTVAVAYDPDRRLALEAQAWPAGAASLCSGHASRASASEGCPDHGDHGEEEAAGSSFVHL